MGMSIAAQMRLVQDQLASGRWGPEEALAHLDLMAGDVAGWIQQVEALSPPESDSGESREGALNGLYAYGDAIGLMQQAVSEQNAQTAQEAIALADEAEALISSMRKATEAALERILDSGSGKLLEDDDRLV
ncbi:MAG: hypothetical protein ACYCW6_06655 [Candidatus Xenobia bacterium]